MPIVDGKYVMRLSTTFATIKQARDEIIRKLAKARKVRISNVPAKLLRQLAPMLKGKDVKIILPKGTKPDEKISELGPVAVTKARVYKNYKGIEANAGSIAFSDIVYNITWTDRKILAVDTLEYAKCIKCIVDGFEGAWRYSSK